MALPSIVATVRTRPHAAPRLRVLALTHRVPFPPDKGDKIRTFHLLSRLAQRADVHLVCFADPPSDVVHRARLEEIFASVTIVPIDVRAQKLRALPYLATTRPLTLPVFHHRALVRSVDERVRAIRPDVIYAESSSMAPHAMAHPGVPLVMDFVDVDSVKWRTCAEGARGPMRWMYAREAWALARFEREVTRHAAISAVTAPRELDLLQTVSPGCHARVLANGVDTEYFAPREHQVDAPSLVFAGAMDYVANIEGAQDLVTRVLPHVRARVPEMRVTLAGSNPTREVRALGEVSGVTVTGFVPDIRPYVQSASVSVCPLRVARGVQNKVLEAMALGVPVVASAAAAEGIDAIPGTHFVVAPDEPRAFADAVVNLFFDPARREALAREARTRVVERYGWQPRADELHSMLVEAAARQ